MILAAIGIGGVSGPFLVLLLGMVFVVMAITVARIHAFLALMLAAMLVGFLAETLPGAAETPHAVRAVELSMAEFGNTAGKIAWVIALASIIGMCLMESGAADRIVRQLVRVLGEKRAGWALLICGFFLGIPVFFDTVFFLLIPLAQALSFRLGKRYVYFVTAIFSGSVLTHSLVPPTPGPLFMVEALSLDLGRAMVLGLVAAALPAVLALRLGRWLDDKMAMPFPEQPSMPLAELRAIVARPESQLPSFTVSVLPVALPVALIALQSFAGTLGLSAGPIQSVLSVLGEKHVAMTLGTVIALGLLAQQKNLNLRALGEEMARPLQTAGVIILITAAGGAFGSMIQHAGVGKVVEAASAKWGINLILLAWIVAVIMKTAQGSGTVAMITTSGMMAGMAGNAALAYDPVYIYLAIGFGSMLISWMNDSGFWVVGKLSGFTEKQTLCSWTSTLAMISVVGLVLVLVLSKLFPHPLTGG